MKQGKGTGRQRSARQCGGGGGKDSGSGWTVGSQKAILKEDATGYSDNVCLCQELCETLDSFPFIASGSTLMSHFAD